ncbi:MAG: helix-turn-helix domain-containing protein [Bdellovibrio sp.]
MSPKRFREMRESLGLTQEELSKALGVAKLTISQYETGFRRPGKTVVILMTVLETLPAKKAGELLKLMRACSEKLEAKRQSN